LGRLVLLDRLARLDQTHDVIPCSAVGRSATAVINYCECDDFAAALPLSPPAKGLAEGDFTACSIACPGTEKRCFIRKQPLARATPSAGGILMPAATSLPPSCCPG